MATQIVAVSVADPGTHEQHIIRYKTATGQEFDKSTMIIFMESWGNVFYTHADGKRAILEIVDDHSGMPYIRTKPDSTTKNNLLSLPRF